MCIYPSYRRCDARHVVPEAAHPMLLLLESRACVYVLGIVCMLSTTYSEFFGCTLFYFGFLGCVTGCTWWFHGQSLLKHAYTHHLMQSRCFHLPLLFWLSPRPDSSVWYYCTELICYVETNIAVKVTTYQSRLTVYCRTFSYLSQSALFILSISSDWLNFKVSVNMFSFGFILITGWFPNVL